jgi:hypothetical protein
VSFKEATSGTWSTWESSADRIDPKSGGSPEGLPELLGSGSVDNIALVDNRGSGDEAGQGDGRGSDVSSGPHFGCCFVFVCLSSVGFRVDNRGLATKDADAGRESGD